MESVEAGYGQVKVLHGLDLEVHEGEVCVLLGANGAGKTTTLRALSGMVAVQGTITFDGRVVTGTPPEQAVRLGIAHVPQGRGTLNDLTVEENLRIGGYTRRDREVSADMDRWYATFPRLAERRTQAAGSLSGGEQQMLAVARALMLRPRLLLLDEPVLGLAPLVIRDLFRILAEINREMHTTMFIVEQNANLALSIASRAYVLETGRIVSSGTATAVREDESVRRAYLGY